MTESATEVLTGLGVLAVAAGFLAYAAGGTGAVSRSDSYPLTASFRSVEGVTVGTDVRMSGVKIGSVTSLALNPTTYFADATVSIRNGIAVPDDSTILVTSEGLLGGAFVEIQPGGSPTDLEPGAEIENTQGAVSVISLLMKFGSGAGGTADGTPPQ